MSKMEIAVDAFRNASGITNYAIKARFALPAELGATSVADLAGSVPVFDPAEFTHAFCEKLFDGQKDALTDLKAWPDTWFNTQMTSPPTTSGIRTFAMGDIVGGVEIKVADQPSLAVARIYLLAIERVLSLRIAAMTAARKSIVRTGT